MSQGRGVRDALKSIIPSWLADRADGLNKGFKVLWVIAQMADGIIETSIEGVRSAFPGLGTPTALAYIGASRRIIRGLSESDDAYAARLRGWLELWTNAASDETTLRLLQAFLGPEPTFAAPMPACRLINRAGLFSLLDSNGVFSQESTTDWTLPDLSWDADYNPERAQWWSDIWIVLYVSESRWPVYPNIGDLTWTAIWGKNTQGLGHQVPREAYQGVMNIIADQKGAHTFVQAVIIATTPTDVYNPATLGSPGDPGGRWGGFSFPDASRVQLPGRSLTDGTSSKIRYWAPPKGG